MLSKTPFFKEISYVKRHYYGSERIINCCNKNRSGIVKNKVSHSFILKRIDVHFNYAFHSIWISFSNSVQSLNTQKPSRIMTTIQQNISFEQEQNMFGIRIESNARVKMCILRLYNSNILQTVDRSYMPT